ncbi:hypothetical protein ACFY20_16290 [Streptomyces sp. NPDC001312]|uniref:hypothetical protein n=1 Tax=Streptomyces sp. NPDC001312 TaxID=3364561 RepID=UPI0036A46B62
MLAGSTFRRRRSASRTGAVLVLLLAALVHVLACAHGPTPTRAARADTPFAVSAACGPAPYEQHRADVRTSAPAHDSGVHCWDGDEPTAQLSRDVSPAHPAVHAALPADRTPAAPLPARPPAAAPEPGGTSPGHARALIGVWRT